MAWGNSSGRAVLWVTLLYGSDSTCVCDASAHVRKSCHKVISHVISDEVFTIYIFVTWISSNFTCGDDTQTYILDQLVSMRLDLSVCVYFMLDSVSL